MKYLKGGVLRRVACASLVLSGTAAVLVPSAASATTVTTVTKGTVSCTVGAFGTYTLALKTKATYNNTMVHGTSQTATAGATIKIPAALNSAEYAAGFRSYNGSVTQALIDDNDATPSPYDAASNNTITIANTTIVNNAVSKLKFKIPHVGPLTATAAGTDQAVAGDTGSGNFATATVDLYTTSNETGPATAITATCVVPVGNPSGPFVVGTITVT
jgi:hypothetical protein